MMQATQKQPSGLHQSAAPPTMTEPSETFDRMSVLHEELIQPAQNDPIEFAQDFGPVDDIDISLEAPAYPVQDSEGAPPLERGLPFASTSSHGHQCQMSSSIAVQLLWC
jgi:hypothetical protein